MNCCRWSNGAPGCSEDIIGLINKCKINNNNNNDNKNNVECNKNHNSNELSCLLVLVIQDENRSIYDFYSSSSNKRETSCFNNRNRRQTSVGL